MKILYLTKGFFHPTKNCQNILYRYIKEYSNAKIDRCDVLSINDYKLIKYDLIIGYFHYKKNNETVVDALTDYTDSGGKLLGIHGVAASFKGNDNWFDLIGGKFLSHPPIGNINVSYKNKQYKIIDELYIFETKDIDSFMQSEIDNIKQPCGWAKKHKQKNVFYLALGHNKKAIKSNTFKHLLKEMLHLIGEKR